MNELLAIKNIDMNVRYTTSVENTNWKDMSNIFKAVGWGERLSAQVRLSFERSSFKRFAYISDELVGVGRTVDDGYYYGWIVDLAVLPEYQRNGIGSKILSELENDLKPFLTTMLTAVPGKNSFYEKLGWHKQCSAYI
ncbi:GNAT family N-acetyltransferase [Adonisia turfae]